MKSSYLVKAWWNGSFDLWRRKQLLSLFGNQIMQSMWLFQSLNCWARHPVNSSHWCQHNRKVNFRLKKGVVADERCKHLNCALTVTNVSYCLNPSFSYHEFENSRQIIISHFFERVVPKLLVDIWIQRSVISRVPIASVVIHPDVEALFSEEKSHRV